QGGACFEWSDARNNDATLADIYVQRMMPDGSVAPGWPANGARATDSSSPEGAAVLSPDGAGGTFLACLRGDKTVVAQHLTADGSIAVGWPSDGIVLTATPSTTPLSLIPDGVGGVVVAWRDFRRGGLAKDSTFDIYGQRLTAAGAIALGWAANGLLLSSN